MKAKLLFTTIASISFVFTTIAQVPAYVPTSGLVGYWPFTGNANDLSGSANNGTMTNGATFTTDRFGNANSSASLDGVNDYVALPGGSLTTLNITGDFSVSFWIKSSDVAGLLASIGDNVTSPAGGYLSGINGGGVGSGIVGVSTRGTWTGSTNTVNNNTWHNIIYVLQSGTLKIYIDNVLDKQVTGILTPLSWTGNRVIGCRNDLVMTTATNYLGLFDDMLIYNRALTPCEITQLYTSSIFTTPTITASGSTTLCAGNSVSLSTSALGSYTWSNGANTQSISVSTANTYTVAVTNGNCNASSAPIIVIVNALPTVSVTNGAICAGDSFTMVVTGANTYTYSSGSAIVTPTVDTSYNVTGTSTQGCVSSNTAVSSVTVNALPTVSVTSGAICVGAAYTMVPNGASTYTYSSGSAIVTPTVNTSYNVTGTSTQGCVSSNTAVSSVTVNALPTVSVTSGEICENQSFTMAPSGASTYTYSSGSAIVSPTVNTSYNVTGTSTQGCVSSNTAVSSVTVNALPSLVATTNNTLLCVGQQATLSVTGAALTYTWSTTANTTNIVITPTVQTTYTINGTDANGCVNTSVLTQSVSTCTSIDNSSLITKNSALSIYPNPAKETLTIFFNSNESKQLNIELFDLLGNSVQKRNVVSSLGENKIELNLNELAEGVYLIKLQNSVQRIQVIK